MQGSFLFNLLSQTIDLIVINDTVTILLEFSGSSLWFLWLDVFLVFLLVQVRMLFNDDSPLSGLLWLLNLGLDLVGQVVAAVHVIFVHVHGRDRKVLLWHGSKNVVFFFISVFELLQQHTFAQLILLLLNFRILLIFKILKVLHESFLICLLKVHRILRIY